MIPDFMLFRRLLCKVYHTQGPEYHGPCRRSAAFGGGFRLAAAATGHMHGGSKENQPLEPGDKFDSGAHARSRSMTGISLKKMSRRNNHCKHPAVSEPPALCSQMMRLTNCHDKVLSPGTLAKNLLKPRMVCMHVTCYFTFKQLEKFISEQMRMSVPFRKCRCDSFCTITVLSEPVQVGSHDCSTAELDLG